MELRKFLDKFGVQLARAIDASLSPVYNPMKPSGVEQFNQKDFPAPQKKPSMSRQRLSRVSRKPCTWKTENLSNSISVRRKDKKQGKEKILCQQKSRA